jgi:BirA family biotin operon repressor/biotin-[acetyl-CoA-carboxylase] ligase
MGKLDREMRPLVDLPDRATKLSELLTTRSFGRAVRWYDEVSSTNTLAAEWASAEAADGSVVSAEVQTAGRGRFDRTWSAKKGENLMFSIILFPGLAADRLGMISVAFSMAVSATVKDLLGDRRVEIKWPNDILIDGAKVCGMLQESSFPSVGGQRRVVVGIGLNVNQIEFPDEIRDRATSLRIASGQEYDRIPVLAALLGRMEDAYYALHTGQGPAVRTRYEASLKALGREVAYVRMGDGSSASGIVTGIDARGALVVSTPTGQETIVAGDVSLRTEQTNNVSGD